jgi:hypothetical protein
MTLTRRGFAYAILAMLGIAVTAALTWSVSRLAGQRIGLQSVPVSVIHGLAPQTAGVAVMQQPPAHPRPIRSHDLERIAAHPTLKARPAALLVPAAQPVATPAAAVATPAPAVAPSASAPAAIASQLPSTPRPPAAKHTTSSSGSTPHRSGGGGGDGRDDNGGSGSGTSTPAGSGSSTPVRSASPSSGKPRGSGPHRDD